MTSLEEVSIKDVTKDQWKDTVGQPRDAETKTWPCLTAWASIPGAKSRAKEPDAT